MARQIRVGNESPSTATKLCHISEGIRKLRKQAVVHSLGDSRERGLAWKIFLGTLPLPSVPNVSVWLDASSQTRQRYSELKAKLFAKDVVSDSPKRAKLLKNIKQDVERTHPEFDYFKDEATRSLMITVLFVHAKVSLFCSTLTVQVHPEYSYKQGMNELLAPIVFVLNQATQIVSRKEESILSALEFVEHDAFVMFEQLMGTTGSWFRNKPVKAPTGDELTTPLALKCHTIFHELLKFFDFPLYSFLCSMDVEPQLYLLRWIRCLFCREFSLSDTLILWDSIFAYDKSLSLVDFISIAMLMEIRTQFTFFSRLTWDLVMSAEKDSVLAILFKYPNVSASTIVRRAVSMSERKKSPPVPRPNKTTLSLMKSSNRLVSTSPLDEVNPPVSLDYLFELGS